MRPSENNLQRTNVINRAICTAKKKEGTSGVIAGNRRHFLDLNKDSKDKKNVTTEFKKMQEYYYRVGCSITVSKKLT